MATTTNYGWTTPDDTDLVKDGAAAIRTLGSSVDTTTKNLNPQTSTGALAYRSATNNVNTALAIGTAGQVLTVNSGATAPEWASPAGGVTDWTLLNTGGTALTGATKITVSFSAKKEIYVLVTGGSSANASSFLHLRINDDSAANYIYGGHQIYIGATNVESIATYYNATIAGTEIVMGRMGDQAGKEFGGAVTILTANTTGKKRWFSMAGGSAFYGASGAELKTASGIHAGSSTVTSVALISSTGNFDAGTVYVYGGN